MAGQTLEHTGAAIVEEYYPKYATEVAPTYPLYSTEIYVGSAILLLSMSMLGLPITAIGYYTQNAGVGLGGAFVGQMRDRGQGVVDGEPAGIGEQGVGHPRHGGRVQAAVLHAHARVREGDELGVVRDHEGRQAEGVGQIREQFHDAAGPRVVQRRSPSSEAVAAARSPLMSTFLSLGRRAREIKRGRKPGQEPRL